MTKDELIKARDEVLQWLQSQEESLRYYDEVKDQKSYVLVLDKREVNRTLLQALDAQIKACDVPNGWQPIETAPRDGTEILICRINIHPFPEIYQAKWSAKQWDFPNSNQARNSWHALHGVTVCNPQFWMPLPPYYSARAYHKITGGE